MSFFKKYKEKKQFNNDLIIARMRNEPVYEGIMSVIYSVHKNEVNFLVMERSSNTYPWPNMKMFGIIGKTETNDINYDALQIIKKSLAPSVNDLTFQKIIKNIKYHKKLNFDTKPDFHNIGVDVFMVEIDDYILRSCRGFKNDEIKNMYYMNLEDVFNLVQKSRLYNPEIANTIQPHFGHMFWTERIHFDLMNKYFKNRIIADTLF